MVKRKRTGPTAERYVEATLELIAERGSSAEVNLREISRRIGCAHTNAYNYFESREDLLWHALRRVVGLYCDAICAGLNDQLSGHAYFRQVFGNMVEWSVANPGLHRFLSSDPLDPERLPRDIIETVIGIKAWLVSVLRVLAQEQLDPDQLARLLDVLLGYLDGEVFNLINGRVLPGEDIPGRILGNLECLFTLLTATHHDGIVLAEQAAEPGTLQFPQLEGS